jgi:hypothetical protein
VAEICTSFELLDLLPDPVQIVDRSGRVVFQNARMAAQFGQAVGRLCYEFLRQVPEECGDCPRRHEEASANATVEIDAPGGRKLLVSHSMFPHDGEMYVLECFRDVTEYRRALEERARAETELEVLRDFQDRCLTIDLAASGLRHAYRYLPARTATGDFLNAVVAEDGRIILAVADVSGRGAGPAAVTFMLRATADEFFGQLMPLERLPGELHKRLYRYLHPDRFLTFAVVVIEPDKRHCRIINAGHPPVLLIRAGGGDSGVFRAQAPPLGVAERFEPEMPSMSAALAPGDRLLLYTDGLLQDFHDRLEDLAAKAEATKHLPLEDWLAGLLPPKPGARDDLAVFACEMPE